MNVLVVVSTGMPLLAVKHCFIKLRQTLTRADLYSDHETVVAVVIVIISNSGSGRSSSNSNNNNKNRQRTNFVVVMVCY